MIDVIWNNCSENWRRESSIWADSRVYEFKVQR